MTAAYIILALCGLVAVAGIIYIVILRNAQKKNMGKAKIKKTKGGKNYIYWLYRLFTKIPLLRRYFTKFQTRISMLYPADMIDVNKKTTQLMAKSSILALICMVALAWLAKTDIFYILISIFTVYIIFTNSVSRSIEKMEITLLKQFATFITHCRSNYHTVGMVDDAIFMTLDELPYAISLHVTRIYEIVISTNVSAEVEKYTDIAPNRFFEMFAAVCATIQEYGDKTLENGESLFLKNLNYIKEEIYVEVNKREKNNYLFSGLIFTAVLPIFGMKLIAMWAKSIAELSSFYEGPMGTIMMILVFVATFLAYELISNLRDGAEAAQKEHQILERLANMPGIRKILTRVVNINYSKTLRIADDLKMTGDYISPQAYLFERLAIGAILGIAAMVVIIFAHVNTYTEILNNFETTYDDAIVPDDNYRIMMQDLSRDYLKERKHIREFTANEIEEMKQDLMKEGLNEQLAGQVANEVSHRSTQYAENFFKWWYILIIIGVMVGGYYAPIALLKYQLSIMKLSMEDEVAQYQTLALILMNVDGMTLDVILEWMERFAFCFKQSISECILNLEASSEAALRKMKDMESFPPFLRFVDNLLNIDDVGVANAFDEVKTEQENYKQQRALNNEIMMAKKSNIGKTISKIPMGLCVAGYLIYPFVAYALKMLQSMGDIMSM